MTVTYSFLVHTATTSTPAVLMKASNPVPLDVKKLGAQRRHKEAEVILPQNSHW